MFKIDRGRLYSQAYNIEKEETNKKHRYNTKTCMP